MDRDLKESHDYLTKQIITYIGNKRELLTEIENEVHLVLEILKKEKIVFLDLFSGSGIVSRLLKKYSSKVITNDLEDYSYILNECFLTNKSDFDENKFKFYLEQLEENIKTKPILDGIISSNYAPKDDDNIKLEDRVFYTKENAIYIDSTRYYIDKLIPEDYKKYFLAELITQSSIHVNTCGVFKGFYKDKNSKIGKYGGTGSNALSRIKGKIKLETPVLSNFNCEVNVYKKDANVLCKEVKDLDLVYLDPPYNEHPYSSNYFMLNVILKNKLEGKLSKVSGIPNNWNRSIYNKKREALRGLEDIVKSIDSKLILVSYNDEGFIEFNEMKNMLSKYGKLISEKKILYNTFRGSRNLNNRSIHTNEFLFLLKKKV